MSRMSTMPVRQATMAAATGDVAVSASAETARRSAAGAQSEPGRPYCRDFR